MLNVACPRCGGAPITLSPAASRLECGECGWDFGIQVFNATPHDILVVSEDGSTVRIPKPDDESGVARVTVERQKVATPPFETVEGAVFAPVYTSVFGEVVNLPPQRPNVFYIVSSVVAQACPGRTDLLVPDELVRDEEGRVVGCRSFRIG